ncbi:MAG: nicotinate dehydrogenase large molybdopterin subunit [Peptococcaceae bacterium BRH_c8a]|nr:MAG: nicotinate dehydrogenase large molybdopterin subunit [Peptococcaceae bacterium BRH_c8a]
MSHKVIGCSVEQINGSKKVTGKSKFTDDLKMQGMLIAKVLRSNIPHARIKKIDISIAEKIPGVIAVLTAKDIQGENSVGIIIKDEPVLTDEKIRRIGEPIALIAAETEEQADMALAAIDVKLEEIQGVFDPEEALQPSATLVHKGGNLLVHKKLRRGDAETAFKEAIVTAESNYITQMVEHAYIEPEAGIAYCDQDKVILLVSTQDPHYDREEIARVLGIGQHKVRVIQQPTGGGFGGKLDISVQCHVALLARATGRPVKLTYTRQESIIASPKRHPYKIYYKSAAGEDGKLLGVKVKIICDTGAYASYGPAVVTRALVHATGPYSIPNVHVDAYGVFTNNPVCGAMRGFGVPQMAFAHESQMDILAEKLNISPWEIRRRNFLTPGAITGTGQKLGQSVGILETLNKVQSYVKEQGWGN